jgi:hypothetical protein
MDQENANVLKTYLGYFFTVILSLSGIITNLIVIKILMHKHFIKQSIYVYLSAIALYDMSEMGLVWLYLIPNTFFSVTSLFCKSIMFLSNLIFATVSWTMVVYSIDRVFSLVLPMKFVIRKLMPFQLVVIFTILIFSFVLNIPIVMFYDVATGNLNETENCLFMDKKVELIIDIYFISATLFLPGIIILSTTVFIIKRLFKLKRRLPLKNNRREIEFARTIISMDVVFILFKLPIFVEKFWFDFYSNKADVRFHELSKFLLYLVKSISFVYNSSPFFIYLIFNKTFRVHFIALFSRRAQTYNSSIS